MLFLAIVLVTLLLPKKQKQNFQLKENSFSFPSVQEPTMLVETGSSSNVSDKVVLIDARVNALNNKVLMAHDRLQRIEEMLLQLLNRPALPETSSQLLSVKAGSVDATFLSGRVEKLMDFKMNAEIEIAAMKEALRKANILPPLEKARFDDEMRQKFRQTTREISETERRAHELVYHAAKK